MKLFKFLFFNAITIALIVFASCSSNSDDGDGVNSGNGIDGSTLVVKLNTAGTLASYINDDVIYKITRLKISGEINGTDIWLLQKMAGNGTDGTLAYLDLSDAKIVAGGRPYYYTNYFTHDDVMDSKMFYNCTSLVSVSCPNSVKEIRDETFYECTGLLNLELPASLKTYYYPFYHCDQMKSIKSKTMTPPKYEGQLYGFHFESVILYVPKGSKDAYKNAVFWGNFENIIEY